VSDRAVRSTLVSLGGQMAAQVLRLVSNIVLARFLPESAFGISGLVFALTTGLWLISDVGIGATVIRSQRTDDRFLHTAWTLSVLRGAVLFAIGAAAGPIAAWFYGEPVLLWMLPLCSVMVLLLGSESTQYWVQAREMAVTRTLGIDLAAQVVALAASVPVAIATGHVVALAIPAVVSAFMKFSLTHLVLPGVRMRFAWDKTALREIFSFGQWIFVSTLFSFLSGKWDTFTLSKLQGFSIMGVFGQAGQIASVPNQVSLQVVNNILTPVLSDAFRGSVEAMRARLTLARKAYLPAGALLFLGAATTAPAFFFLAYTQAFAGAGRMAQVLMLPAWLAFVQEASSRALLAAGDGRGLALTNVVKTIATVVATAIGFALYGFWGFLGGVAVGGLVGVVGVGLRLRRHGVFVLSGDLVATAAYTVALALACGAPVVVVDAGVVDAPAALLTLVSCVLVCGPLALVVLRLIRQARRAT
jgi:O-antigen/teichoic acid export membrane protein